ncbi:MAG: hypothetical protein VKL39_07650, partial [Leptolyngbyaceae bacterium]|nr:hypothetical protein [Leptolyngbyaceae bacterium]
MVLSFVSAGLIGVGHAFDSRPQQTSPQTIRRALAKSPKLLATHQQLAESIQPTRVALDEGSSPVSNSQIGDEAGDKNIALVGDRPSPRQQIEHRVEPITVLLSEQAVQLIASSGLAAGSSTPQTVDRDVDRENAARSTASLALNRSAERSDLEPLNAQAQPPSSEARPTRESEASVSRTAQSPILSTESQPTRTDSRADSRVSFV